MLACFCSSPGGRTLALAWFLPHQAAVCQRLTTPVAGKVRHTPPRRRWFRARRCLPCWGAPPAWRVSGVTYSRCAVSLPHAQTPAALTLVLVLVLVLVLAMVLLLVPVPVLVLVRVLVRVLVWELGQQPIVAVVLEKAAPRTQQARC